MKNSDELKILFITTEFGADVKGGLGRVINGIVNPLLKNIKLDVLHLNFIWKFAFSTWYAKKDTVLIKKSTDLIRNNLKKAFKATSYDLVHIFMSCPHLEEIIQYIKENHPSVKMVYSCHSIGIFEQKVRNGYPSLIPLEKFVFETVDAVHLLNRSSEKILNEYFPEIVQKKKIAVIPNGVDSEVPVTSYPADPVILCISRWSHGKGLEILIDAIPSVIKKYPKAQFIFGGRKVISWEYQVSSYVNKIDQKIKKYKKNIKVFGWLNDKKRIKLMAEASIWVMPSLLEYFPYGILEPMAMKLPILTSRFTGADEMIEDGKECLMYDPANSAELAEKLIYLIEHPSERTLLAENAYRRSLSDYRWEIVTDKYQEFYQEILKK